MFEQIRSIVCEQLGVEEEKVTVTTTFEELQADSLDLFQVIIELEEAFGVEIQDAEEIKSIQDAMNYIEAKKNK